MIDYYYARLKDLPIDAEFKLYPKGKIWIRKETCELGKSVIARVKYITSTRLTGCKTYNTRTINAEKYVLIPRSGESSSDT